MSRTLQLVVAVVISVVCVLLSLVDIAPKDVFHPDLLMQAIGRIPATLVTIRTSLAHANWGGFLAVCALTIFGFWVRTSLETQRNRHPSLLPHRRHHLNSRREPVAQQSP